MTDNGQKSVLNMSARVFVANVPSDKIDNAQMKQRFEKYGKVLDVFISKTFAFIQFELDTAAAAAIKGESGTLIEGNKIDCSLARKQPKSMRPPEQMDVAPPRGHQAPFFKGRERSPLRYDPRQVHREYAYGLPDPYGYDDGYGAGEAIVSARDSLLVSEDPLRPPRPRTPEYIRDLERRHAVHRRQLEDNTAYHIERMRNMKEEHKLRMEILELEKEQLELKVYGLQQQQQNQAMEQNPSHHPPRQDQPPLPSAMRSYAYTPQTSAAASYKMSANLPLAASTPRNALGMRPTPLMNQPPGMGGTNLY